ncbi:hypothetical protein K458DRAFT_422576 [Lentithecium fluviatile CBS 122367]|uniref:Uncharacterized protein n=1 Tax=Lentithecium fluviatile CBS 122367 TaxID=1168545 RepID=A0A6G1ILN0_9PLEO|nr:hypothetical protein K458DRAFT_422576 [Lentithecium fluviatile CBS 122367]
MQLESRNVTPGLVNALSHRFLLWQVFGLGLMRLLRQGVAHLAERAETPGLGVGQDDCAKVAASWAENSTDGITRTYASAGEAVLR